MQGNRREPIMGILFDWALKLSNSSIPYAILRTPLDSECVRHIQTKLPAAYELFRDREEEYIESLRVFEHYDPKLAKNIHVSN